MGDEKYRVVINHEEQYSIWPVGKDLERGWRDTRFTGSLKGATRYIEEVWTDMRPLSFRKSDPAGPHRVVINHEEQYSVWPEGKDLERGWKETGRTGNVKEAMHYIEEVWTDMRPLSLRR
jgi:MbtH protein